MLVNTDDQRHTRVTHPIRRVRGPQKPPHYYRYCTGDLFETDVS